MNASDVLSDTEDAALIRALLDTDTYDDAFRARVRKELEFRGLTVASFANHVYVRELDDETSCSIPDSLAVFDRLEAWRPVEWTNALGERVTIQRDTASWILHRHDETGYLASVRLEKAEARKKLERVLNLEKPTWEGAFDLDDWPAVDVTASNRFVQRVAREFGERDLDHIIIARFDESGSPAYELRVAKSDTRSAETLLSEFYDRIHTLQTHAEALADTDDRKEELKAYNILADLLPGRPAVFYNRASILYEMGNLDEAIEGLLEALSIGMPRQSLSHVRGNSTGLFQLISQTRSGASYPEYFEDIEAYLQKIEPKRPENIPLLHGLATLARLKNETGRALGYYTRITDIDPDNQIARTNQAILLAEEEPS